MSVAGVRKAFGLVGVLLLVVVVLPVAVLGLLQFRPVNAAVKTLDGWWVAGWAWYGRWLPDTAAELNRYAWLPLVVGLAAGGVVGWLARSRGWAWTAAAIVAGLTLLVLYVPAAGVRLADGMVWAGQHFDQFRQTQL